MSSEVLGRLPIRADRVAGEVWANEDASSNCVLDRSGMIGVFDVGYSDEIALVGCVAIEDFADADSTREWVVHAGPVGPYVPGEFYRRELGPLLQAVRSAGDLSACVIDAYVDLGEHAVPGLGRILHEQTGIPVIGVAKSRYPGTPEALEVFRGVSTRRCSCRPPVLMATVPGTPLSAWRVPAACQR